MRKTLGVTLTTAALLFGGAGVANATAPTAPVSSSTTTVLADDNNTTSTKNDNDSDKTGLWGLLGLLGLAGLAGLKRRKDADIPNTAVRGPNTPRA